MIGISKNTGWLFSVLTVFLSVGPAFAADICPVRQGQPLQFLDVFDGAPEENAILVPDDGDEQSGQWNLAYVYDAGRFVTVRCKYADKSQDVKLPTKITKCNYTVDKNKVPTMTCE